MLWIMKMKEENKRKYLSLTKILVYKNYINECLIDIFDRIIKYTQSEIFKSSIKNIKNMKFIVSIKMKTLHEFRKF